MFKHSSKFLSSMVNRFGNNLTKPFYSGFSDLKYMGVSEKFIAECKAKSHAKMASKDLGTIVKNIPQMYIYGQAAGSQYIQNTLECADRAKDLFIAEATKGTMQAPMKQVLSTPVNNALNIVTWPLDKIYPLFMKNPAATSAVYNAFKFALGPANLINFTKSALNISGGLYGSAIHSYKAFDNGIKLLTSSDIPGEEMHHDLTPAKLEEPGVEELGVDKWGVLELSTGELQ
ncbi:hypothetical protein [Candidatus Phycorickettsia trachydisci]|nr:hypothetical protein [Candidatus Phycorickettsia trachydisci]